MRYTCTQQSSTQTNSIVANVFTLSLQSIGESVIAHTKSISRTLFCAHDASELYFGLIEKCSRVTKSKTKRTLV